MQNPPTVAILGGGVAGMSAAHELAERGFKVSVYEMKSVPGGKSRSVDVAETSIDGSRALPGEHGFRFFPRFYKHMPDTMKRIPLAGGGSVFDNLIETTQIAMPQYDAPPIMTVAKCPDSWESLMGLVDALKQDRRLIEPEDAEFYYWHVLRFATSCEARRLNEYEKMVWWDFIQAENRSEQYKKLFAHGITRSLVAAQAQSASTKTIGMIFLQLQLDMAERGTSSDRILNAPTHDAWTGPWMDHLRAIGVEYHLDAKVLRLDCTGRSITGAVVKTEEGTETVEADYYVLSVPVEKAAPLMNADILAADPSLALLTNLAPNVRWMNGMQIYLSGDDVPITHGHAIYVDSAWALTTVSQHQFWKDTDLSTMYDGQIKGILSVDISEWQQPGLNGKTAQQCTKEEIFEEVWNQLKKSLNVDGRTPLRDDHVHFWYLDTDIVFAGPGDLAQDNAEPLLVNNVGTWSLRPSATTQIKNLFLASDYVQTNTDLATMEGANEAARRATNAILDVSCVKAKPCAIWKMEEPEFLRSFKELDAVRYEQGLPSLLHSETKVRKAMGDRLLDMCRSVLESEVARVKQIANHLVDEAEKLEGTAVVEIERTRMKITTDLDHAVHSVESLFSGTHP